MNSNKDLTDEEIAEISQKILDGIRPIAAKLSGEKLPKRLKKKDQKKFVDIIRYFENIGKRSNLLNYTTLPQDFKSKQQVELVDEFLGDLFGLKTENPIQEMVEHMNLKILYDRLIQNKTQATNIQKTIHEIFYTIGKAGRIEQFEKLTQSMGFENAVASFQSAERINQKVRYVLQSRKRFSKRIVERHIEIYKEISGFLETIIIILYGMKLIIANKYKPFKEIRNKNPIGNIVKELKKDKSFSILIGSYNHLIRNSIMHSTYNLDPLEKKIEFFDKDKKLLMEFSEFVSYIGEITRRAIILSRLEYELTYLRFIDYKEKRAQVLKKHER